MTKDKSKDYVVILGSGESINQLTKEQRKFINSCSVKIAINKFAAFYEKAEIVPTHIYFTDHHIGAPRNMLLYIIDKFKKEKIRNITFIVSIFYSNTFKTPFYFYLYTIKRLVVNKTVNIMYRLNDKFFKRINVPVSKKIKSRLNLIFKKDISYISIPSQIKVQYVDIQDWLQKGGKWAKDLNTPLYHFKGSISSTLNYVSIVFPNKKVLLVGVDMNSSKYFFEEELNKLDFITHDWTDKVVKKNNKHISIIPYNGVKIDDEMPYILRELSKTNNTLFSINKNSYFVEKGYIELKNIS